MVFVRPGRANGGKGEQVSVNSGGLAAALMKGADYLRDKHPGLDLTTKGPHLAVT
jgi:hypothetical protein